MSLKEFRKPREEIGFSKTWRRLLVNRQMVKNGGVLENPRPQVASIEPVVTQPRNEVVIFDRSNQELSRIQEVTAELKRF